MLLSRLEEWAQNAALNCPLLSVTCERDAVVIFYDNLAVEEPIGPFPLCAGLYAVEELYVLCNGNRDSLESLKLFEVFNIRGQFPGFVVKCAAVEDYGLFIPLMPEIVRCGDR